MNKVVKYFISDKLVIRSAGKKGRGVFVRKGQEIKQGEIIEVSPVIYCPEEEYDFLEKTCLSHYIYNVPMEKKGIVVGLGYSSMYNHSFDPNADWANDDRMIRIWALKTIPAGKEVLIHYGWEHSMYKEVGIKY